MNSSVAFANWLSDARFHPRFHRRVRRVLVPDRDCALSADPLADLISSFYLTAPSGAVTLRGQEISVTAL